MEIKKAGIGKIEKIYEVHMKRDFPPDELKPLVFITDAVKGGRYDCFTAYNGEEMLGYACLADCGGGVKFLDYFAVVSSMRGGGIGSEFFKELGNLSGTKYIVFEVESIESAANEEERNTRIRRIDFYKRNGAADTGRKYVVFGVEYNIMINRSFEMTDELTEDACRAYEAAYERILGRTDREYIKRVK